jgi:acetyltransferase-like isoleucine patch superfamily enzyme
MFMFEKIIALGGRTIKGPSDPKKKAATMKLANLKHLNNISLIKTLYFNNKFGGKVKFRIYRKASVKIKPTAVVQGEGKVSIGYKWPGYRYYETLFSISDNARLIIKGDFIVHTGCKILLAEGANLELGNGGLNNDSLVECCNSIKIGQGVFIGSKVTIMDSNFHTIVGDNRPVSEPIVIQDHVLIGTNAMILKGVTIGEGAVICAGALVKKDIPPRTLAGGVPAKILRENIEWRL